MSNNKQCLYCGRPLVGRQRKFCSDAHRQAYNRAQATVSPESDRTVENENRSTDIVTFDALRTAVARLEGENVTLQNQLERSDNNAQRLTDRVITLERENARLAAQLEQRPVERDSTPAARGYNVLRLAIVIISLLMFAFMLILAAMVAGYI